MLSLFAQPIGDRKHGPNELPTMSNAAVREMLALAVFDSNLFLGYIAFQELQLYDFYHSAQPDECIEIIPTLRRAARWTADEAKPKSFGGPFGGTFACTPSQ